jgi:hypothetical protein
MYLSIWQYVNFVGSYDKVLWFICLEVEKCSHTIFNSKRGRFAESLIPIKKTSGKNKSSVVEDQHRIEKSDLLHSIQVLSGLANTVSWRKKLDYLKGSVYITSTAVITSSGKRLLETQSFCNCRFNHTDLFFNLSAPHNVSKCESKTININVLVEENLEFGKNLTCLYY